ncbi:MAG: hypothetical protein M1828_006748 [Chrysothrix sp. TS-e1954]|nr:MAG: hypothetical protein M1828_006748 [Chrysothrix sp. TS-e1954]
MACSTITSTVTSFEEPATSKPRPRSAEGRHRRRHSSYTTRPKYNEYDNIQLLVDRFLAELGRRLDFLDAYGQRIRRDSGIDRAYATLHVVRDSCAQVSDEMVGAGRRRAKILVDTLEARYKGTLVKAETMEQKAQQGVRLMDNFLAQFELRAYAQRGPRFAAASEMLEHGRRRVDNTVERAREVVDVGLDKARRASTAVGLKIDRALKHAREHGLLSYEDLPEPWRVNPHILSGYRFSESKVDCLRSVLNLSNEFFNIWSHLIGLFIVLAIACYFYPASPVFSLSSKSDIAMAFIFFGAAAKCLVCSTLWHTMSSISSQPLMERFACVDYTGISLLVATSIMTTEYCAFYCEPVARWIYITMTFALGIGGTILPWHPTFNKADMAWARVAFYVLLSATGSVPVFQLVLTRGVNWAIYFYAPIAKSLLVYLAGAVLYAMKVPERWWPGMFDYVGGSHNLWHLAVLSGILFHYTAMQELFKHAFTRAQTTQCSAY